MALLSDRLLIYSQQAYRSQVWSPASEGLVIDLPSTTDLTTLFIVGTDDYQLHVPPPLYPEHGVVEVQKRDRVYHGHLIEKTETYVVVATPTGVITVNHYDTVETQSDRIILSPRVAIPPTESPSVISYLIGQCSWHPYYHLIITHSHISELKLIADIQNQTTHPLNAMQTRLIATRINLPTPAPRNLIMPQAAAVVASSASTDSTPSSDLRDIIHYDIGPRILGPRTQIPLASWHDLDAIKLYWNVLGNSDVSYGYRFNSPTVLPAGSARIYLNPSGPSLDSILFIGATSIDESQEGDSIDLSLGVSTVIKVDSHVETMNITPKLQPGTIEDVKITSTITNRSNTTVRLILKYWIGHGQIRMISCHRHHFTKGFLEFILSLKPHDNLDWNCQFQVASV
jgi:hypothetical protein